MRPACPLSLASSVSYRLSVVASAAVRNIQSCPAVPAAVRNIRSYPAVPAAVRNILSHRAVPAAVRSIQSCPAVPAVVRNIRSYPAVADLHIQSCLTVVDSYIRSYPAAVDSHFRMDPGIPLAAVCYFRPFYPSHKTFSLSKPSLLPRHLIHEVRPVPGQEARPRHRIR